MLITHTRKKTETVTAGIQTIQPVHCTIPDLWYFIIFK